MPKAWREVSIEARARGYFTGRELDRWTQLQTCPAAEAAIRYGVGMQYLSPLSRVDGIPCYHSKLHGIGNVMGNAIIHNNFDEFDRLLDLIDDTALQLKREAHDA